MREYWARVIGAWCLLIVANRILKSAERMMRESMANHPADAVTSATTNGSVEFATAPEVTA